MRSLLPVALCAAALLPACSLLYDGSRYTGACSVCPMDIESDRGDTVTEIASENNSTTIFPLPLELFRGFFESVTKRVAALPEKTAGEPLPAPPRKTEAGA